MVQITPTGLYTNQQPAKTIQDSTPAAQSLRQTSADSVSFGSKEEAAKKATGPLRRLGQLIRNGLSKAFDKLVGTEEQLRARNPESYAEEAATVEKYEKEVAAGKLSAQERHIVYNPYKNDK